MSEQTHHGRCAAHCTGGGLGRRTFLQGMAALAATAFWPAGAGGAQPPCLIRACGPASQYRPVIKAAFVRRKGEYGMLWPGAVWDGEAARRQYAEIITACAQTLNTRLDLRPEPIYSDAEAEAWLDEARQTRPDGLMVLLLDRQQHAWPTAAKAAALDIPLVVWSPLGTSFTTNTAPLADKPGCVILSTDDTGWLAYGARMLATGARLKRARAIMIAGAQRTERPLADLGMTLRYVPAQTFIEEYNALAADRVMEAMARDYTRRARRQHGATRDDVLHGIKSYFVASRILEREQGDAISMDCLGALGKTAVSLPCIAWSRMNDDGIPAACEADAGAVVAHFLAQHLLERPGFQQDPVADTADDTLIGAHCSCPTRLRGGDAKPLPFDLIHHHGNRDAVPRTLWPAGERATVLDVLPGDGKAAPTQLLISGGEIVANIDVPPAGGCVVSVKLKIDGTRPVLAFPGFHQLFILGDHRRQLSAFCQLQRLQGTVV